MVKMILRETPIETWDAIYTFVMAVVYGETYIGEDYYNTGILYAGNWYFFLEQPWEYKDLLLEYGLDLDTQWTFGMILHDLLRGTLDAETLEYYLTGEYEEPVIEPEINTLYQILDIYRNDTGELLNNE